MPPNDTPLTLRPLTVADEAEALAAHTELAADGFTFLLGLETGRSTPSWPGYLEQLERLRLGRDVPERFVPSTFLVADVDGRLVGRTSVRHELNAFLATWGGHIGYGVRPAFRRRGYATEILRQSLGVLGSVGVERALVTCDVGNLASAAVIERCGGVLENVVDDPEGPPKRRYWLSVR